MAWASIGRHQLAPLSLAGFLDRVLRSKRESHEERRVKTALRGSGLPVGKSLEDCDFSSKGAWNGPRSTCWPPASLPTAILDRLLHHCHVVQIDGRSYRLRQLEGLADG